MNDILLLLAVRSGCSDPFPLPATVSPQHRSVTLPTCQETYLSTLRNAALKLYYPIQKRGSKLESTSPYEHLQRRRVPRRGPVDRGDARARDEHRTRPTTDRTSRTSSSDKSPPHSSCLKRQTNLARSCRSKRDLGLSPCALSPLRRKGAHRPPAHDGSS